MSMPSHEYRPPRAFIIDLDLTLVNSEIAANHRKSRNWAAVYSLIPRFTLYPGITELWKILFTFPVAIVTSAPSSYAWRVARHFDILPDCLVGYHDTLRRKPHPDPILRAIDELRRTAKWSSGTGRSTESNLSIWCVGDRPEDVESAQRAGATAIGALWGSLCSVELERSSPSYLCNTPSALLRLMS